MNHNSIVWQQQKPLYDRYQAQPELTKITDVAWVKSDDLEDPFHSEVMLNDELRYKLLVGLHRAVGGLHDLPNPGDILSADLAAYFESTLKMIANRFNVKITKTHIKASAHVDVKGTLMIDSEIPVGFTTMDLSAVLTAKGADPIILKKLTQGTEHCVVVYQTLVNSFKIKISYYFNTD